MIAILIPSDDDDNELKTLDNSINSILSELVNDSISLSKQSSEIDAATAVAESTVDALIENLQVDESICKNKMQDYVKNITDYEINISKSASIETMTENPPLEQTIAEGIDLAVTIAVKSDEIEKNSPSSSTNVSIDGLKDDEEDSSTENVVNDESIAAFLPFFGADAKFSSSEKSSGDTTPIKATEHKQGDENIYTIVHDIMAAVDQLFECVF